MKLMTINLHALPPSWGEEQVAAFADAIAMERPDVVALQELFTPLAEKSDPLAPILAALAKRGAHYHGLFRPVLTSSPITSLRFYPISATTDEYNWKKREILMVSVEKYPQDLFCTVHFGRWEDEDEPFGAEWERTLAHLAPFRQAHRIWLMGDFNNPAHREGEGYDQILADGWQDCFVSAVCREGDATVMGAIDGWAGDEPPKRIDYIFCNSLVQVSRSKVIFDGERYPVVSDHFGVCVEAV